MASSSILLHEEQVQCSICLDIFTNPVSTPCGHNFCKVCITSYWDTTDQFHCPMCKEKFNTRPELRVNIFINDMVAQLKMLDLADMHSRTPKQALIRPGLVTCVICTGPKPKAVKSCLVCLASYCEIHLEPHQKHKLIDPVENLEDRVCKKHERPLEMFCRVDQTCVCQLCTEGDHKDHETVPIEEECEERKAHLKKIKVKVQKRIQERQQTAEELKLSTGSSKPGAGKENSEMAKLAEKKNEELIQDLEEEIADLQKRSADVEQLLHTEDHLYLLQSSPPLSTLPRPQDGSGVRADADLCVDPVKSSVSEWENTLREQRDKLPGDKLIRVKKDAVDVTFDPDTAHCKLLLSADKKQVRLGLIDQNLPDNPERFDYSVSVLGKKGWSSGRFYYEILVRGKTRWVLGVARESVDRKGPFLRSPDEGHWAIGLQEEAGYKAHAGPDVVLSLKQKPQKVGVFVDYEEGEVSFYDVEAKSCIYSFTGCSFTERLFPCFSTGVNDDGKNSAPLIISPVSHMI